MTCRRRAGTSATERCSSSAASRAIRRCCSSTSGDSRRTPSRREGSASPAASEMLALVADGLTNRAIADRLYLSPRTVQKHLEHAFARLGAHNRIEALRLLHGGAPPQR